MFIIVITVIVTRHNPREGRSHHMPEMLGSAAHRVPSRSTPDVRLQLSHALVHSLQFSIIYRDDSREHLQESEVCPRQFPGKSNG